MGKSPEYNLVIRRRDATLKPGERNENPSIQIGVGFEDNLGVIGIRLNDGIVLDWRMDGTHTVRLYPADYYKAKKAEKEARAAKAPGAEEEPTP